MSIPYIVISSDSEDEGTDSSATILSGFDLKDYSKEDPSEEDTSEYEEDAPLSALRKMARAPQTLLLLLRQPSLGFIASPPRKRTQSASPSDTIAKAMAEVATLPPRKRMLASRYWDWVPSCSILGALRRDYPDVETLQATLGAAHERISDLELCLDESEAREADLETRIRALEEQFGPSGSS
ncbi:hypothetical protein Tco_1258305 [Tanacetum coccineum]